MFIFRIDPEACLPVSHEDYDRMFSYVDLTQKRGNIPLCFPRPGVFTGDIRLRKGFYKD